MAVTAALGDRPISFPRPHLHGRNLPRPGKPVVWLSAPNGSTRAGNVLLHPPILGEMDEGRRNGYPVLPVERLVDVDLYHELLGPPWFRLQDR